MSKMFRNHEGYTRISKEEREGLVMRVKKYLFDTCDEDVIAPDGTSMSFENWCMLNRVPLVSNHSMRSTDIWLKMEPNRELSFKEDYGDIDLITLCDSSIDYHKVVLSMSSIRDSPISDVSTNGNVTSFLFRDSDEPLKRYHVDIVRCYNEENYENMLVYYCNGIVNNFIGQFLRAYNIKSGHNGIYYLYRDMQKNVVEIFLMGSYRQFFLKYFGIDLSGLRFETFESVCAYLINLPFFCGVENYRKVNSSDKKRVLKLHGLSHDLYNYIMGLTDERFQRNESFHFLLSPEHQKIVDDFIKNHEIRVSVNQLNRKSLFEFIEARNVPQSDYNAIFSVMMPILNKSVINNITESEDK